MHRKQFVSQMNNLKIEFDRNLGKVEEDINSLKQLQLLADNSQLAVEFQDKLINENIKFDLESTSSINDPIYEPWNDISHNEIKDEVKIM